jgi:2-iminobutanoate/2-iminopropanoate deaminase
MKIIHTDKAPAAVGPYSQAIAAGIPCTCPDRLPSIPAEGRIVATTIEAQAEQCCCNIEEVLAAAGTDMSHVLKTTCFLADIADFKAFNEVYAKHFISKPARSCVAVKALPAGALCEVEAVAEL